jgi:DNA recombination protein RmuC
MFSLVFLLSACIGAALIGALAVYAWLKPRISHLTAQIDVEEKSLVHMSDRFKALSSEALDKSNQQFLLLATENLQRFQDKANDALTEKEKAIQQLIQPVTDTLQKMDGKIADLETKREGAYAQLKELVSNMRDQHVQLQQQTSSLVQTLRAPTSRGQWGETQLKTVLDFSNLVEGVHYHRQATTDSMRPDVVVQLPPDKVVLIDAKVPLHNYQSAMQSNISDDDKNAFLVKHAADVRNQIKNLSSKDYTKGFNSFDWVVMFLPLEGAIQMAMDKQPDLMEFAWSKNIILATPTNLLALMRTVSYAHEQFKVNENAKEIASLAEVLYQRIIIFAEHFATMGKGLSNAMDAYNQAVGSLERNILTSLRKMKNAGVKGDNRGLKLQAIEETPRKLTAPELVDIEKEI